MAKNGSINEIGVMKVFIIFYILNFQKILLIFYKGDFGL